MGTLATVATALLMLAFAGALIFKGGPRPASKAEGLKMLAAWVLIILGLMLLYAYGRPLLAAFGL